MGERTRSRIGTNEGVRTVRVYSANPKTVDGFNTFIFRRDVARSLSKLAWAPVIDARQNRMPVDIAVSDERVQYSREQKKALILFLTEQLRKQYGPVENDDFGCFVLQRLFAKEVQRHALATRREYVSTLSARSVASGMVHFAAAPNEEIVRRNGIRYFEYGLAKVRMDDGLYLIMGEVGVRSGSCPYYDQHVVAKFKADSEVSSLQGHIRIGESAFEQIYDNRFRLILQGVEMYYNTIKQTPKLSINIPVYNAAPFLPRCLDSVCAAAEKVKVRGEGEQWKNSPLVEVICVDDGSTDGSGAILDEYASRFNLATLKPCNHETFQPSNLSTFRVLHQQNGGEAHAREAALRASTGDWIASVDPDDWVEADFLANLLRVAESSDADLIWCDYRKDYEDGRPSEMSHECAGDDLDAYVLGILNNTHAGVQWNKLIRRAFVMQHDLHHPDGRIPVSEDLWFTMTVLNCRPRIRFAPYADYHYYIRRGSATQSPYTPARFAGFVRLQEFLEGLALSEEASRLVRKRRKGIKFGAYRHLVVSDDEFYRLYPEVRDLWDHDTPIWHKVLFWFAVRGFKPLINRLWR